MKLIGGLQKANIKNYSTKIYLKRYQRVAIGAISGSKLFTYPIFFKDNNGNEFKEIVISQFPPKHWYNTFRLKFWIKDEPGITNLIFNFLAQNKINIYTQESIMTRFDEYFTISVVADMTYFINKINNEIFISDKHIKQFFDYVRKDNNNIKIFDSIKSKIEQNIESNEEKEKFENLLDKALINNEQTNLSKLKEFIDKIRNRLITKDDYEKFRDLDYKVYKLQLYLRHLFFKDPKLKNIKSKKEPTVKKLNFLNKHSGRYIDSENINHLPDNILNEYRMQDTYESIVVDCGYIHLDKDIIKQIGLPKNNSLNYTINSDTDEKYILVRFFEKNNIVQLDIEHKAGRYGVLYYFTNVISKYKYNIISSYDRVQNADTINSKATSHWIVMLECTPNKNDLLQLIKDLEDTEKVINVGIRTINSDYEKSFNGALKEYKIDTTNEFHCETKEVKNIHNCYHNIIYKLISEIKTFVILLFFLSLIIIVSVVSKFSNINNNNSLLINVIFVSLILLLIIVPFIMKSIGYKYNISAFNNIFRKKKLTEYITKQFNKLINKNSC